MKQDKQREINRLEQSAQQTMAENRQLKDDIRVKEEVSKLFRSFVRKYCNTFWI